MLPEFVDIGKLEVIHAELQLFGEPNIAISHGGGCFCIARPDDVVDRVNILQEGSNALQAISQFGADGVKIEAPALLKVSELCDFETIEHHLPAHAPCSAGRPLPVVLFKLEVVLLEVDSDGLQ